MSTYKIVETPLESKAYSKVLWRLVPFLFLCYVVAYLDRVVIPPQVN